MRIRGARADTPCYDRDFPPSGSTHGSPRIHHVEPPAASNQREGRPARRDEDLEYADQVLAEILPAAQLARYRLERRLLVIDSRLREERTGRSQFAAAARRRYRGYMVGLFALSSAALLGWAAVIDGPTTGFMQWSVVATAALTGVAAVVATTIRRSSEAWESRARDLEQAIEIRTALAWLDSGESQWGSRREDENP